MQLNFNKIQKLKEETSEITDEIIEDYIEMYRDGCGCLEFIIKICYFVILNSNKIDTPFEVIRRIDAYSVKKELQKRNDRFRILLESFKTLIWNATKHPGTIKNPVNKTIKFVANEGQMILTYKEFMNITGRLYSVIFLLSRYPHIITMRLIFSASQKYDA